MKRIICLFFTVILLVMMTTVAYAADSSPTDSSITDYLTWEFLGTMAGAIAATTLLTQFLKMPIDKVWRIPTRFIVYIIALLILLAVQFFTDGLSLEKVALIILNAVIVATSSWGAYEATIKKIELKGQT